MSFSAEINDFVNGVKAGAAVGGDARDAKLAREKFEFDRAFKEKSYGASSARADRALDLRERALGIRASEAEARKHSRAAKDAAKESDKVHKAEVKDYNEVARSEGGGSRAKSPVEYSDDWDDFEEEFPEEAPDDGWEESALPVEEVTDDSVRLAAEGGLMEEDEDEEVASGKSDAVASAIPEEPSASGGASVAPPKAAEGKEDPIFKETAQVTKEVMDEWNSEVAQTEAISTSSKKSQDRIAEVPPASVAEMKAMWAKIDPNGELDGQLRGAKTLVSAYKFFMSKGDAVKAKKIAGQIIKFNQMASMTQGQMALEALREGDLKSASRLVTDAANENIPDGVTISAEPTPKGTVLYKIDRAGYAQQQGELGAKQMWELATGVANGSQFVQRMAALAGQAQATDPNEPGPIVTDGSKPERKKRSYTSDVMKAAQAKKNYLEARKQYDSAVDEGMTGKELAPFSEAVASAESSYNAAWKTAQKAAKATKRPRKTFLEDFNREFSAATPTSAIPTDEEEPKGDAAAILDAPATAPAAGRPMDPDTMAAAKAAIAEGRSRAGVIEKLKKLGYNTEGL